MWWILAAAAFDRYGVLEQGWAWGKAWDQRDRVFWDLRKDPTDDLVARCETLSEGLACTVLGMAEPLVPERLLQGCRRDDPDGCGLYALALALEGELHEDVRELVRGACRAGSATSCVVWLDGVLTDASWGGLPEVLGYTQYIELNGHANHNATFVLARYHLATGRPELAWKWGTLYFWNVNRKIPKAEILNLSLVEVARRVGTIQHIPMQPEYQVFTDGLKPRTWRLNHGEIPNVAPSARAEGPGPGAPPIEPIPNAGAGPAD